MSTAAAPKPVDTRGLAGQTVGDTTICAVTQTELIYRGYEIADLAEHASFEEVAFLLLIGHKPSAVELDAFRKDDGERAFGLATVAIRDVFGTAQKFMEMVRKSYPVVYRPNSVLFETPVLVEGEVVQPVRMTDGEGRGWVALYPMQRQPDGSWRTNGCQLSRLGGQVI